MQTVTDQGNITTNNIIIENNGNDPDYGALTISGGYALAHLRGTGTVAYLQFQNSTTSYGTMSNVGMTIGNNGHDAYVTNRQALGNLYLGTSGEARVAIKPDGDVGIGTLTPTEKLHADGGDVRISDGTPVLTLHDTSSSALTTLTLDGVNTTLNNAGTNGSLIFSTESTEAMRIDEDGKVGIGTTAPSEKLHVLGKTRLGGRGYTGGANIEYASFSETNGGASTIVGNAVHAGNSNNTYRKTRSDNGNFIALNYNKGITFHTRVTGCV